MRNSIQGFNNSVEGDMGSSASLFQSLMIQVDNSVNRKMLEEVRVSIGQSFAGNVASTDRYAKLIICTGKVPLTSDEPAIKLHPFFPSQTPALDGVDRIHLSTIVKNEFTMQFRQPIEIIEGQILNVILGTPWTVGDSALTASASFATLSIIGREYQRGSDNYSFVMV